jgi:hypothetical protein
VEPYENWTGPIKYVWYLNGPNFVWSVPNKIDPLTSPVFKWSLYSWMTSNKFPSKSIKEIVPNIDDSLPHTIKATKKMDYFWMTSQLKICSMTSSSFNPTRFPFCWKSWRNVWYFLGPRLDTPQAYTQSFVRAGHCLSRNLQYSTKSLNRYRLTLVQTRSKYQIAVTVEYRTSPVLKWSFCVKVKWSRYWMVFYHPILGPSLTWSP